MQQIFSNTTLTVNQLIEKIDTGELVPAEPKNWRK